MSKPKRKYIVVENAGYERECDVFRSPSYLKACTFMRDQYDSDELDDFSPSCLHVMIACEIDGERTYEI